MTQDTSAWLQVLARIRQENSKRVTFIGAELIGQTTVQQEEKREETRRDALQDARAAVAGMLLPPS